MRFFKVFSSGVALAMLLVPSAASNRNLQDGCTDEPGWYDAYGETYDCDFYENCSYCCSSWGADYPNPGSGSVANEACCACGGGSGGGGEEASGSGGGEGAGGGGDADDPSEAAGGGENAGPTPGPTPGNFCDSNPCENGSTCVPDVGECICVPPFTGEHCDVFGAAAAGGSGRCTDVGWWGGVDAWEDSTGADCASYEANEGDCDSYGGYFEKFGHTANTACCTCGGGEFGVFCDSNPCQNDGTCNPSDGCTCVSPYTGEYCEVHPCDSEPCQNGGTCSQQDGSCDCSSTRFVGETCEVYDFPTCPDNDQSMLVGPVPSSKYLYKQGTMFFEVSAQDEPVGITSLSLGIGSSYQSVDPTPQVLVSVGSPGMSARAQAGWQGFWDEIYYGEGSFDGSRLVLNEFSPIMIPAGQTRAIMLLLEHYVNFETYENSVDLSQTLGSLVSDTKLSVTDAIAFNQHDTRDELFRPGTEFFSYADWRYGAWGFPKIEIGYASFPTSSSCSICEMNPCNTGQGCNVLTGNSFECDVTSTVHAAPVTACEANNVDCNGGSCDLNSNVETPTCTDCPYGMIGDYCELDDPCLGVECVNGVCLHGACSCFRGFYGDRCENESSCNPICGSMGTCNEDTGECVCMSFFSGETMQAFAEQDTISSMAHCRCGSRLPWKDCHLAGLPEETLTMDDDNGGVYFRYSPLAPCYCKSGKTYWRCCWESPTPRYQSDRAGTLHGKSIVCSGQPGGQETIAAMVKLVEYHRANGIGENEPLFGNLTHEEHRSRAVQAIRTYGLQAFTYNKTRDMDPEVYAGIVERLPDIFFFWRDDHWTLEKKELKDRVQEWNDALEKYCDDEYISGEERIEVMKLHKASPFAPCANPVCTKIETKVKEHKACTRCRTVAYCSKDCQRAHWKEHKKGCVKR